MVQRIVSLISSATEILFELGIGDRVVGVSHECDFPAAAISRVRVTRSNIASSLPSSEIDLQVKELSSAGAALYELDVDSILKLRPDLIVTQSQCDVCAVRYSDVVALVADHVELQHAKLIALNPLSLADVFEDVQRLGQAAGAVDESRELLQRLKSRVAKVSTRIAAIPLRQRPRTVCIEWTDPLMLAANWTPELISLAGGMNGLTRAGQHSAYCSWADLLQYDPDVIVVAPCGFDLERSKVEARELKRVHGWNDLSAVRSDRVFIADGNAYFNRSGPRLVDTLEILACVIHPHAFGDLSAMLPENCLCPFSGLA